MLFACAGTIHAQLPDYHIQLFDYTAGIKPGNIKEVKKDADGFLWILYPHSVQRYDGREILTYKMPETLQHVYCDSSGNIWLSSYEHTWRFKDEFHGFVTVAVKGNGSKFSNGNIFEMPGSGTWLITTSGFCSFNKTADAFEPLHLNIPVAYPYNVRGFANKGNTLFFRHDSSVYAYNIVTKKVDSLPDTDARTLLPVNEDSILLSSWSTKSYWYNFKAKTISPAAPPPSLSATNSNVYFNISAMAQCGPHEYFIAAREGFFKYNNLLKQYTRLSMYYNGMPVNTNDLAAYIFIDKTNYVWLATINGIARFPVHKQTIGLLSLKELASNGLPAVNNVRRVTEDKENNLWLATGNGIACWKKSNNKWIFFPPVQGATDRLAFPSVRGMVYDGKYLILGPTDLGVWLFNPENYTYKRPIFENTEEGRATKKLSDQDFIDDIITLKNGDHLITGRDMLYIMDGKTYTIKAVHTPASTENTNFAFQTADSIVWITTNNGLHCLTPDLNYLQKVKLPFINKSISCGVVLNNGELLFASNEGLYTAAYNKGNIVVKKYCDAFDKVFVTALYQDKNNIIWASSESGIFRYNPLSAKLDLFDHSDNVQGYSFNSNSFLNSKGYLFFGGTNGINYLHPETFSATSEPLKVLIHKVSINNNDSLYYSLPANPELKYNHHYIDVEFASPYFNNADKVNYRYQLTGYDKMWKYVGTDNYLRFTSLPAGKYNLRVQGRVNADAWVEASNSFAFTIAVPFWQKWWFLLLCALATAGSIYWFIKFRHKLVQDQLETQHIINHFASSIYEQENVDHILWDVAKNCIGRMHFEDCVVYLLDEQRNVLVQKAAYGPKSPEMSVINNPMEIAVGKGITGAVALSGQAEIISDTTKDSRYIVDDQRRFSEIAVPIKSGNRVLGVIDCEHTQKNFFQQKHLSILTTVASLCANKIIKVHAEDERQNAILTLIDTQRKMSEVEMQALRAQMNPHFIFNCLNSINRYIVKSDQQTASLYLTKFAKLIRLILDNSNSHKVVLSNELEALKIYIDMEALRFDKKFTFHISVAENITPETIDVPPLIIQPYVENAIWHGLLHKDCGGHLAINISMPQPCILQCVIQDDGIGRQKANALKSKSAVTNKSLGMKLTEERLALLNKHAASNASIEIIDLFSEEEAPAGTKVIITIPL